MSENKFIVIDEKPKRDLGQPERAPLNRVWIITMIVLGAAFFLVLGMLLTMMFYSHDRPTELELTANTMMWVNTTIISQQTETMAAIQTYSATLIVQNTLIVIYQQQTQFAAAQSILSTSEAQAVATLTAIVTSAP